MRKSPNTPLGCEKLGNAEKPRMTGMALNTRFAIWALMFSLAIPVAKAAPEKASRDDKKIGYLQPDESGETSGNNKEDITIDILKEKGRIIRGIERGLKELKSICNKLQSKEKLTGSEKNLIDKLLTDYGLVKSGSINAKLKRVLNYQKKHLFEYCEMLIQLITHANILNIVECEGCYRDGIKAYHDALEIYKNMQVEIGQLQNSI